VTRFPAVAGLLLALSVRAVAAAPVPAEASALADRIGKASARIALKQTHGRGTLIDVHVGDVDQLTVIAVHGFRGQATDLAPLIDKAIAAGQTVKVFAYDDRFRSLEDASRDRRAPAISIRSIGSRCPTGWTSTYMPAAEIACSGTGRRSTVRSSADCVVACASSRTRRT
jgi:hypothetical protein